MVSRTPRIIKDWRWTLFYDPDTRTLNPTSSLYVCVTRVP
jgi:hypothetical protein